MKRMSQLPRQARNKHTAETLKHTTTSFLFLRVCVSTGMCEQRAYYWFIVDLLRKAAVTVIYTFGGDQYQYILLVFFVLFAINHDIAQPYRGKTENLFAFITLMFIIILIHTSTVVTYGSMLPMFMAAACVFGVFIIFFFSTIYAKKAAAEEAAETDRIKRKAQDLWGEIASK